MQVAVEARYLCEPFGSMTVFCGALLRALATMDLGARPAALVPRALHDSARPLAEELGEDVIWLRPSRDRYRDGGLRGELLWVQRDVPELLARHLPSADLVMTPYHHSPRHIDGVRRVAFVHDLCGLGEGFPKHKKAYWRHYLRLRAAVHLPDAVWPVSRSTSQALATRFRSSIKRLGPVLYNVVERELVSVQTRARVLQEHGLERHGYAIAFATRQHRKNFAASLGAMVQLQQRGQPLQLVGIAPPSEAADVQRWCHQQGLGDALILTGVPQAELDGLYAGALALLWPSTCEGFGYPVVEAMAQGCPALVWEVGPGAELVEGTIPPLTAPSADLLADRLASLRRMGAASRDALEAQCRHRASDFGMDAYRDRLRSALHDVTSK